MSKQDQRKALGKGLHSLLPARSAPAVPTTPPPIEVVHYVPEGSVQLISIEQVKPNPDQPRRDFDQEALLELAQSIERDGIIQPLLARKVGPTEYQIIAGERRWRAAGIAGLKEVPVIIRDADDQQVLELAIIENIQREDLNPIELAMAFQRMANELSLSHEQIGQKTGKQRTTITNSVRLLQLPTDLQQLVASNKLSSGHARALLKFEDEQLQRQIAQRCVDEGLVGPSDRTIHQTRHDGGRDSAEGEAGPPPLDANVKSTMERMLVLGFESSKRVRTKARSRLSTTRTTI